MSTHIPTIAPYHGLNDRQRAAVMHDDRPLLIIAGAGTGKTTTLAHRAAHHIHEGTHPGRILLLTFTRRAAGEMLRRVDSIVARCEANGVDTTAGPSAPTRGSASSTVWGGTFHSVATRLLRLHGASIGLDPAFTILDRADAEDLMNVCRTDLGLSSREQRFPQKATCLDIYSRCVDTRERLDQVLERSFPWCREHADDLRRLFSAYVDHKAEHDVMDYDDLLLYWHGLLQDPVSAVSVRGRFDRVLVDEYQDTNRLQAEIVRLLCPDGRGLTVVGDDAQAIYGFRAATVRNILDFPDEYPDTVTVTLEQNYRSVGPLLEATNAVIAQAGERFEKDLWTARPGGTPPTVVTCLDEQAQTDHVVRRVLALREEGLALRRQAILFRAAHHSLSLEVELARRNIPFVKYGGLKFAEMAHVKDLLAFLRLGENPRDLTAGLRVLLLLPGVGPRTARELMAAVRGPDPFGAWRDLRPPAAARQLWPDLVTLLTELAGPHAGPPAHQVHRVRQTYAPLLERLYTDPVPRMRDLEQIEQLAGRATDRSAFLAELALDPPSWTGDLAGPPLLDEDYLVLSTIHSAKGLEWDAVFVIHAADGNIPSDLATGSAEEIDEELRLFYVALSRARDHLTVCCPLRYYPVPRRPSDAHGYAQVTRFLPPRVRRFFTEEADNGVQPAFGDRDADGHAGSRGATVTAADIRARQKAAW